MADYNATDTTEFTENNDAIAGQWDAVDEVNAGTDEGV